MLPNLNLLHQPLDQAYAMRLCGGWVDKPNSVIGNHYNACIVITRLHRHDDRSAGTGKRMSRAIPTVPSPADPPLPNLICLLSIEWMS